MRYIFLCQTLVAVLAIGCQPQPATDVGSPAERATAVAKQLRKAMADPSIMQLDMGPMADSGLRGIRQREVAKPFMNELMGFGKVAADPLWELINDEDASIRRAGTILLGSARTDAAGKPGAPPLLADLHIPLLERALTSKDDQVRYFACDALGNFADWSDDCLDRLRTTLPKLRDLRNDSDNQVRSIAWMASNKIASALSTRAKTPEDRTAAAQEFEQLQREKNW